MGLHVGGGGHHLWFALQFLNDGVGDLGNLLGFGAGKQGGADRRWSGPVFGHHQGMPPRALRADGQDLMEPQHWFSGCPALQDLESPVAAELPNQAV